MRILSQGVSGMDTWDRIVTNFLARIDGPLHFRIFLQPAMAIFLAVRDGRKDARLNRPPYFWDMVAHPSHVKDLLEGGIKAEARVIFLGLVMDAIYQAIELHWFYVGEAIVVVLLFAFIPYVLARGPADRIARWWTRRSSISKAP
jgi:hypothetical protein